MPRQLCSVERSLCRKTTSYLCSSESHTIVTGWIFESGSCALCRFLFQLSPSSPLFVMLQLFARIRLPSVSTSLFRPSPIVVSNSTVRTHQELLQRNRLANERLVICNGPDKSPAAQCRDSDRTRYVGLARLRLHLANVVPMQATKRTTRKE